MTYLAGHPRVNIVFATRVEGSNISTNCALSTAGSHSLRSSGVDSTDFQASSESESEVVGNSSTQRQVASSLLPALRCMCTSVSSGSIDLLLPLDRMEGSAGTGTGTCFHSGEEEDWRWRRKVAWASSSALYHDLRKLVCYEYSFHRYSGSHTP